MSVSIKMAVRQIVNNLRNGLIIFHHERVSGGEFNMVVHPFKFRARYRHFAIIVTGNES